MRGAAFKRNLGVNNRESTQKLPTELHELDEADDGVQNDLPDAPGIELSTMNDVGSRADEPALSEPWELSADEVAQFVSTQAKHSRNLQCSVDA